MSVKGTVSVILKYPKCKDDNVRYKAVPFKQLYGRYRFFIGLKVFNDENTIRFPGVKMRKSFL